MKEYPWKSLVAAEFFHGPPILSPNPTDLGFISLKKPISSSLRLERDGANEKPTMMKIEAKTLNFKAKTTRSAVDTTLGGSVTMKRRKLSEEEVGAGGEGLIRWAALQSFKCVIPSAPRDISDDDWVHRWLRMTDAEKLSDKMLRILVLALYYRPPPSAIVNVRSPPTTVTTGPSASDLRRPLSPPDPRQLPTPIASGLIVGLISKNSSIGLATDYRQNFSLINTDGPQNSLIKFIDKLYNDGLFFVGKSSNFESLKDFMKDINGHLSAMASV